MPSVDRKWLPPVLIAMAAVASLLTYGRLPAMVELRLEGMLPFDVSETADLVPRWLALSLIPALALVLWAAFRAAPTAAGQRVARLLFRGAPDAVTSPEQFERFRPTYDAIVLGVVILVLGVHAAIIAAALEYSAAASRIIPGVLGACLILMGNVMPRLRPNWVAGVRTKRALEDPQLWRTTHRAFGTAFVVSGFLTILVAVGAPRYGLLTGIAGILASCVVGLVASTRPRPTTHTAP
jgi:SdpI/YhfL family protein